MVRPLATVEYWIKHKDGRWVWFYDRGSITKRKEDASPYLVAGIVFDVSERKEKEINLRRENAHLQQVANVDDLTQINNRRAILSILDEKMLEAKLGEDSLCIIMLDIDHFKVVNDNKGHVYGDDVLRRVAQCIEASLRTGDELGRYGGEEFLAVLPQTTLEQAAEVTERIRLKIASCPLPGGLYVTISGGVALCQTPLVYDFIEEADLALYEAKHQGRDCIVVRS